MQNFYNSWNHVFQNKRTITWNKYQSKVLTQAQNRYLDYLTDPSFQEVNRVFVISIEYNAVRTGHTQNFRLKVEIENHNGMVDEENSYNYAIDNYDDNYNDDYATGWLLDSLFQRTL